VTSDDHTELSDLDNVEQELKFKYAIF